ncbi:hypothetical protein B2J88_50175 [Rhodococcus sp. SRB_17]|nr:hypothetical protein [Rhodococcus sp. SRB_17]
MTLTDVWLAYMTVLRERAPITAGAVRPPRPRCDREDAEYATTPWTAEVREFFSLHDGQYQPTGGGDLIGTLFPNFGLLCLDEVVAKHQYCRDPDLLHDTEDLGDDWVRIARQQSAGEVVHMFVDPHLPFAENGSGDVLCVDMRGGQRQGCVRDFGWEGADESDVLSASLADYVDSVRISVESGIEHSGLLPTVEDGALIWEVDYSDSLLQVPAPEPAVIRLPFAVTGFLPSQIGQGDDLIDLEVVRRTVIDTAQSLHPRAVVNGCEAVFRQVPRQRGVPISWFVGIDAQTVAFVAVVTGVGNDVIVHEMPEGGASFVQDK